MVIHSIIHQTKLSFDDFVLDLMGRRVKQGDPEQVTFKGGYLVYTWTDGIDSIISIFSPSSGTSVQEISIS